MFGVYKLKIKYIGKRPEYLEGCYGSNILFNKKIKKGIKNVDSSLGLKLIRHPDQFIKVEDNSTDDKVEDTPTDEKAEDDLTDERTQEVLDSLVTMDKDSMADFVVQNFVGVVLDKRGSEETVRGKVTQLIHQYGIV